MALGLGWEIFTALSGVCGDAPSSAVPAARLYLGPRGWAGTVTGKSRAGQRAVPHTKALDQHFGSRSTVLLRPLTHLSEQSALVWKAHPVRTLRFGEAATPVRPELPSAGLRASCSGMTTWRRHQGAGRHLS